MTRSYDDHSESGDKIDALLKQRGNQWGDAVTTHARIAQIWSGILDHEVTAQQVALCMVGLKLLRAAVNPDEPDSYDDGHGYLKIAERIIFDEPIPYEMADVPMIRVCKEHQYPIGMCQLPHGDDQAQQLRRAATVTDEVER